MWKPLLISLASFVVFDFLWLGFVVKDFNVRQLSEIGRIENGEFKILFIPALLTYLIMALIVTLFVLPRISPETSWLPVFGWGALMGFLVFGVFDLTNLAILKNYPVRFCLADMAWGTLVFGLVSLIANKFQT